MNNKYKMIVADIDDTLINSDFAITKLTKEALIEAQKKGIKVVLCTGRPTKGIEKFADELMLDKFGGYLIAFNGANIVDAKDGSIIYENNVDVEQLHKLRDLAVENNVGLHTYSKTHILAEDEFKYTKHESNLVGIPIKVVKNLKETVKTPVVKAIMVAEPSVLNSIDGNVLPKTKDLSCTYSKPYFLEFMNKGVDKGLSLKHLCDKLNIKASEVIAFGDSQNDIPMLKFAGKSVAMGNSADEIKEVADFVARTNNEDGIYHALKMFL